MQILYKKASYYRSGEEEKDYVGEYPNKDGHGL